MAFQRNGSRLSAGIVSINDNGVSGAGLRGFAAFRSLGRTLAQLFGANELELFGAAINNPAVRETLEALGFHPSVMNIPDELGGGAVDVYSRVYPVRGGGGQ